jgi:predicted AAA+ superfamily ATPase
MDELLKKSLLKQKEDNDWILARSYIDREENKNAEKYINNNLVKIIVGPRRCGKSTFAFLLLKERNIKFAYANLEDENLIKGIAGNNDDLTEALQSIYGDVEYIIFDEIQNLDM